VQLATNGTCSVAAAGSTAPSGRDHIVGIYSVVMGGDRWSLKLVSGRGLFNTNDLSVVVFQSVRPR
jgi:hypothetical protein